MSDWFTKNDPIIGVPHDAGNANAMQGLVNSFTGNLDFERSRALSEQANEFSALEAQKARDWQTEMSNTAYQRAAADLKAAGLNPALVLSGASGASSGSGAVAHASTARSSSTDGFRSLANVVLSAINVGTQIADRSSRLALADKRIDLYDRRMQDNLALADKRLELYDRRMQDNIALGNAREYERMFRGFDAVVDRDGVLRRRRFPWK